MLVRSRVDGAGERGDAAVHGDAQVKSRQGGRRRGTVPGGEGTAHRGHALGLRKGEVPVLSC